LVDGWSDSGSLLPQAKELREQAAYWRNLARSVSPTTSKALIDMAEYNEERALVIEQATSWNNGVARR
jgi:hypothetical protein